MWNDGGLIRYSPFVVPLQRRAHSSQFRPKRRPSTWPFCSWDTVHARTVWSWPPRRKATRWNNSVPLLTRPLSHLGRYVCQHGCIFEPNTAIIDTHSIMHHSFADDLQLHMSAPPDRIYELLHSMQSCISDVKAWATANMLKLNDNKT